jgi:hypothetical protein
MYVDIHTFDVYAFPINFIMQIYYITPVVGEKGDKDPSSKYRNE